jgi:2-dehydro-3-deoxygluconokinase
LIGNAAAVRAMLGADGDEESLPQRLADRFGPRLVALTRRELLDARDQAWSAALYDAPARALARSRRHEVRVVDRVGGGDSFAGALIARLLCGEAADRALEFAVAASALKLTVPGDFARITSGDVERFLSAPSPEGRGGQGVRTDEGKEGQG